MRILFNKIFPLSLLILVGCSKSDDDSNAVDNTPSINSIQVSVSSAEVTVGTTILFTVFDNTGKNRTSEAKFYVDGTEISGSSYTFNDVGTYEVYANTKTLKARRKMLLLTRHRLNTNNMF